VPPNAGPIPYSPPSLLEKCSEFAPSLHPTAVAPPRVIPILSIHPVAAEALKPAAAPPAATAAAGPAAAPRPTRVPLATLIVQHREALRAGRSLTSKIASRAVAASNLPPVAVQRPPLIWPGSNETAIEMPYRLIISPNQYGAWAHASKPVSSQAGRTELWHTRLGIRPAAGQPIDESAAARYF
jgi:hypothetical protein